MYPSNLYDYTNIGIEVFCLGGTVGLLELLQFEIVAYDIICTQAQGRQFQAAIRAHKRAVAFKPRICQCRLVIKTKLRPSAAAKKANINQDPRHNFNRNYSGNVGRTRGGWQKIKAQLYSAWTEFLFNLAETWRIFYIR